MPEGSASVKPAPMEGNGVYNRNSQVQAAGLSPAVSMLERAAQTIALPAGSEPVVIADYGSSQGRNSLLPLGAAVAILRGRIGGSRAISVVHIDLPDNDFCELFQTLNSDPKSYLRADSAAFASAIGQSFYKQVLPAESVSLGWTSWAVQWLSRVPSVIPDHVQVALSHDLPTRAAFARQAAEDWEQFLIHRERELRPGGILTVMTMAVNEDGDFGYRPLLNALYSSLLDMVDTGFLEAEELRQMTTPTFGRSRAEFEAPFGRARKLGKLRLEEVDIFTDEDHFWADHERHRDAQTFAARWAAFTRASLFPTLASSLKDGRDDTRAADFFDRLEEDVTSRLASDPEPMLIPLAKILLVKDS